MSLKYGIQDQNGHQAKCLDRHRRRPLLMSAACSPNAKCLDRHRCQWRRPALRLLQPGDQLPLSSPRPGLGQHPSLEHRPLKHPVIDHLKGEGRGKGAEGQGLRGQAPEGGRKEALAEERGLSGQAPRGGIRAGTHAYRTLIITALPPLPNGLRHRVSPPSPPGNKVWMRVTRPPRPKSVESAPPSHLNDFVGVARHQPRLNGTRNLLIHCKALLRCYLERPLHKVQLHIHLLVFDGPAVQGF